MAGGGHLRWATATCRRHGVAHAEDPLGCSSATSWGRPYGVRAAIGAPDLPVRVPSPSVVRTRWTSGSRSDAAPVRAGPGDVRVDPGFPPTCATGREHQPPNAALGQLVGRPHCALLSLTP